MTQDELRSRLFYEPETGIFTRLHNPDAQLCVNNRLTGRMAGSFTKDGYVRMSIDNKRYMAHRLAFLYVHGFMPTQVDHIDGNRANNRMSNLRSADALTNARNMSRSSANKSGVTGVGWSKRYNRWIAYINSNGRQGGIRRFKIKEDAIAYRKVLEKKYGYHPNHGRDKPQPGEPK